MTIELVGAFDIGQDRLEVRYTDGSWRRQPTEADPGELAVLTAYGHVSALYTHPVDDTRDSSGHRPDDRRREMDPEERRAYYLSLIPQPPQPRQLPL
jgi:hypothetical protein